MTSTAGFEEIEQRNERIRELFESGRVALEETTDDFQARRAEAANGERERALRTIARNSRRLSPEAGDRLDELVRRNDPGGIGARYLTASSASSRRRGAFPLGNARGEEGSRFRSTMRFVAAVHVVKCRARVVPVWSSSGGHSWSPDWCACAPVRHLGRSPQVDTAAYRTAVTRRDER